MKFHKCRTIMNELINTGSVNKDQVKVSRRDYQGIIASPHSKGIGYLRTMSIFKEN